MGRVDLSSELFKGYSEEDQDEILQPRKQEVDELQAERDKHYAEQREHERTAEKRTNALGGDASLNTMQIVANNTHSNALGSGGDTVDFLNAFSGLIAAGRAKSAEREVAKVDEVLVPKKKSYEALANAKDQPVDQDKLNMDLDALYASQVSNYNEYRETQVLIERKKNQIVATQNVLFARHGKMKEELEELNRHADELVADFIANDDQVRKASGMLTPDQMERFDDIADKMAAAIRAANPVPPKPGPAPVTAKPEQESIVTAVGQQFVNAGTKLTCPFAMGGQSALMTDPSRKVFVEGPQMANIMDFKPMQNIPTFGMCNNMANPQVAAATAAALGVLTPQPCVPNILAPWSPGKADVLVEGIPALLSTDTVLCAWAGKLTVIPEPPEPPTLPPPRNQESDGDEPEEEEPEDKKEDEKDKEKEKDDDDDDVLDYLKALRKIASKLTDNELQDLAKKLLKRALSKAEKALLDRCMKAMQKGFDSLQKSLETAKRAKEVGDLTRTARNLTPDNLEGISNTADDLAKQSIKHADDAGKAASEASKLSKLAKGAKAAKGGLKYLGPLASVATLGVGYALEDTSNYATSVDDASRKHEGFEGGSVKQWGEVIADYGVGFYKDKVKGTFLEGETMDSIINFGGYVVRDTADTVDAVVEIADYLGDRGAEMGAALADALPAPGWLIDIFG